MVSSDLSFNKQVAAALGAAGVPVEGAEAAAEVTVGDATTEVDVGGAKPPGRAPKKSGGVFGYLFGGGGVRDQEPEAEDEAGSAEGEYPRRAND